MIYSGFYTCAYIIYIIPLCCDARSPSRTLCLNVNFSRDISHSWNNLKILVSYILFVHSSGIWFWYYSVAVYFLALNELRQIGGVFFYNNLPLVLYIFVNFIIYIYFSQTLHKKYDLITSWGWGSYMFIMSLILIGTFFSIMCSSFGVFKLHAKWDSVILCHIIIKYLFFTLS